MTMREPDDRLIAECLRDAGISAPVAATRHGLLRKVMVRLADGAGYVKLALHPLSAALLRNEAAAYGEVPPPGYVRPRFRLLMDRGEWAAAWLSAEEGEPFSRWGALGARPGPFEGAPAAEARLDTYLGSLGDTPRLDRWRRALTGRHGAETILLGASHGDFVHWNVLRPAQGRAILFDFEYYSTRRSPAFDRCHWMMAPLLRRGLGIAAARWGAAVLAARLGVSRRDLAIAVTEHAARLEGEHDMPDFAALTGSAAMERRLALLRSYDALMARLLS